MTNLSLPHTLVAGTPENINDVTDNLNAIVNKINGSIDAGNLEATILGQWRTVAQTTFAVHDLILSAGLLWANQGPSTDASQQMTAASPGILTRAAPIFFPFDPADYTVTGMTTQLRLRMGIITNATATTRNFVGGMHSVQGLGGGADTLGMTLAAAVVGSTVTRNAPVTSAELSDVGSAFTPPVAGLYALGLNLSGIPAADSAAAVMLMLQVNQIP